MKTVVSRIEDLSEDLHLIDEAAASIKKGGTVVFPTETVYGLGADALNSEAVKKIFEAKGRPQDNPLIIHVASKDISRFVKEVPEIAQKMMDKFWPGPLTMILNKKEIIPDVTSANLNTIGVRMPNNKVALKLIELSGTAIAAPSANISGRPSPTDIERCEEDLLGKVNYIIGGEKCQVGVESTILDCTVNPPIVLRPGGITLEMLKEIDPLIELDKGLMKKPEGDFKPKAPGMKYKHYAPKANVRIISGKNEKVIEKIQELSNSYIKDGKKVGILASRENAKHYSEGEVIIIGSMNKLEEVARNLFEDLRKFDDKGMDIILSEAFEEQGVGIAVMNRLKKSAGYDIIDV
ncbi:MAG: threonylcarbamoyl-AMP synthase [Clostridium sp.]|uniref:L-threonylcarbamoyladenylate synthase n=1 Tax=Clostridium sp. DSM 8431 TaxID=1761781 RepID=UPI0008E88F0A|nr:L-threonylcarbamoyladenylate synthase [Clostridium sp. DSM 8431]MCR4943535.1 threonylcarbamoyl-AMP synthase [Clostridium sp.]SFU49755.1 L-threonylcarbamoyladenylate synthase [Clostridium sp. DSM 8431]